jgi:alpha-glucosidase (family GH31 glycosyl hydrolase)
LLEREHKHENRQRAFVLTRSAYFGTQKYAAKWTGDNRATSDEIIVSFNQLLTLSLSGIHFVGADIPGFYGNATDEIFVKFYQLGTFFPFMRAHSHKES